MRVDRSRPKCVALLHRRPPERAAGTNPEHSNPNSNCAVNLAFAPSSGVGSVNTVVTASPAGCSRIADNVRANEGSTQSSNAAKIVVPPQIMIKMVVGEAGGQPGDIDQQAILVSARNRFGDNVFPGGKTATWQAVVVPAHITEPLIRRPMGRTKNWPTQPPCLVIKCPTSSKVPSAIGVQHSHNGRSFRQRFKAGRRVFRLIRVLPPVGLLRSVK